MGLRSRVALGLLVAAALVVGLIGAGVDAGWWVPDRFGGDLPTVESGVLFSSRGTEPESLDLHEADLVWTLDAGGSVRTDMSVSRDEVAAPVYALAGSVRLDGDDCPAAVAWTITPPGAAPLTFPALTASASESAPLEDLRLPGSPGVRLDLRRLDGAACPVEVRWRDASFRDTAPPPVPRAPGRS